MTRVIALLSVLLCYVTAFAGEKTDSVSHGYADITGTAGLTTGLESPYFSAIENTLSSPESRDFIITNSYGLVKLYFPSASSNIPTSGKANVDLDLDYYYEDNGAIGQTTESVKLEIDMGAGIPMAYVKLDKALKISASITASDLPSAFSEIALDVRIVSQVYNKMLYTESISGLTHDDTYLDSMGSLRVFWNPLDKAEHYELEWTYISNQDPEDTARTLPNNEINLREMLFKTNSSRVEIASNSFDIPLVYEKGIILYRVRPVGKNVANNKLVTVKGAWSLDENYTNLGAVPANNYYLYDGLELNMNWQSSISFAEEGKNKVVLSYHDGTARNRQAVTRINSDERAVVGETFYDYNGRPVIQVLPVPTTENNLNYFPEFNQVETTNGAEPIYKASFDTATTGTACVTLAPKMDTSSGAAGYYSQANPFDTSGNTGNNIINRNLIPNAKGYPYTQTKYTSDNTGRIAAQSGVGKTHLLNSDHETIYLYGTPEQEELTRLFGNQVGSNAHYKKNVVIDPNGQVSVSYLDMDGKVIATALAGGSPDGLDTLEGENSRHIQSQLLNAVSNKETPDRMIKSYSKNITVSENLTNYQFTYSANTDTFAITCYQVNSQDTSKLEAKEISLSSVLDVQIELLDCGTPVFDTLFSTTPQFGNGTRQDLDFSTSALLNQGQYTLNKTLSINDARLKEYLDEYIKGDQYTCVIPIANYLKDSIVLSDISGCGYSCEDCQDNVENLIESVNSKRTEEGDPLLSDLEMETMRSKCYDLCRSNITCASALNRMLGDVSIAGQYGEIREKNLKQPNIPSIDVDDFNDVGDVNEEEFDIPLENGLEGNMMGEQNADVMPERFPLSVFHTENILPKPSFIDVPKPNWHYPVKVVSDICKDDLNYCLLKDELNLKDADIRYEETDYFDPLGEKIYVNLTLQEDGSYDPEIQNRGIGFVEVVNERLRQYKVPLKYIKDVSILEDNWWPHFARYLVFYHPEYEYFVECTGDYDINEFEYQLVTAESLNDDPEHKFFDENGISTILDNDPLLQAIPDIGKKIFELKFRNYKFPDANTSLSMVQVANLGSGCPIDSLDCPGGDNCPSDTLDPQNTAAWNLFKSLYLTERQKVMRVRSINKSIGGDYYNGCIGDPDYWLKDEAASFFQPKPYNVIEEIVVKDCGKWFWQGCTSRTVQVTNTRYAIPFFNSNQTCFIWRSRFFKDKDRVFYPPQYDLGGTLVQGRCTRQVTDDDGTTYEIEVNCREDDSLYMEQVYNAKVLEKYKDCGLCPLASDLQDFLVQVNRKNYLSTTAPVRIACPPTETDLLLGSSLSREFLNGRVLPEINWEGEYDEITKKITGEISSYLQGATKTITVTLDLSAIPEGLAYDSMKICCLNPIDSNNFSMKVYFNGVFNPATGDFAYSYDMLPAGTEQGYEEATYTITGHVENLNLTPCTLAPSCALTGTAKKLTSLLNALNMEVINEKANHLVSTNEVRLDQNGLDEFYEYPLRNLIDMNGVDEFGELLVTLSSIQPKWSSSKSGNLLSGTLSYLSGMETRYVQIEIAGSVDFDSISYFTNLQPVNDAGSCNENVCKLNSFTADAVVIDSDNNKNFIRVTITVPMFTVTVCEQVLTEPN